MVIGDSFQRCKPAKTGEIFCSLFVILLAFIGAAGFGRRRNKVRVNTGGKEHVEPLFHLQFLYTLRSILVVAVLPYPREERLQQSSTVVNSIQIGFFFA
ncbi:MAG: MprA protease, GlyGly-CTERM protein-sorting domain-containing form [Akkermansia sp.]|nr:MprA protease, GlyGly-CTERM protein-sorting domain-containing form [Akkermansia sp.]